VHTWKGSALPAARCPITRLEVLKYSSRPATWLLLELGQGVQKLARTRRLSCLANCPENVSGFSHKKVGHRSVRGLKKHIVVRIGTRPNPLRRLNPQASFANRTK